MPAAWGCSQRHAIVAVPTMHVPLPQRTFHMRCASLALSTQMAGDLSLSAIPPSGRLHHRHATSPVLPPVHVLAVYGSSACVKHLKMLSTLDIKLFLPKGSGPEQVAPVAAV